MSKNFTNNFETCKTYTHSSDSKDKTKIYNKIVNIQKLDHDTLGIINRYIPCKGERGPAGKIHVSGMAFVDARYGNDTKGKVEMYKPFRTIQAAYQAIITLQQSRGDPSLSNSFKIVIMPGIFYENLTLSPYVSYKGSSKDSTIIYGQVLTTSIVEPNIIESLTLNTKLTLLSNATLNLSSLVLQNVILQTNNLNLTNVEVLGSDFFIEGFIQFNENNKVKDSQLNLDPQSTQTNTLSFVSSQSKLVNVDVKLSMTNSVPFLGFLNLVNSNVSFVRGSLEVSNGTNKGLLVLNTSSNSSAFLLHLSFVGLEFLNNVEALNNTVLPGQGQITMRFVNWNIPIPKVTTQSYNNVTIDRFSVPIRHIEDPNYEVRADDESLVLSNNTNIMIFPNPENNYIHGMILRIIVNHEVTIQTQGSSRINYQGNDNLTELVVDSNTNFQYSAITNKFYVIS